jgi:hypothetical protein
MPARGRRKRWTHWITDRSPVVLWAGGLTMIFGLIVAIPATFGTIMMPVHGLIDGRVDIKFGPLQYAFEGTNSVVRDLQIEAAEGKLANNRDSYVKWEIELRKTRDPSSREIIQRQMRELELTRGGLEQQLRTLRELRNKRS